MKGAAAGWEGARRIEDRHAGAARRARGAGRRTGAARPDAPGGRSVCARSLDEPGAPARDGVVAHPPTRHGAPHPHRKRLAQDPKWGRASATARTPFASRPPKRENHQRVTVQEREGPGQSSQGLRRRHHESPAFQGFQQTTSELGSAPACPMLHRASRPVLARRQGACADEWCQHAIRTGRGFLKTESFLLFSP